MNAVSRGVHEVDKDASGVDVSKPDWMIRIIAVPPGEAPLWVREKWVGLDLPVARYSGRGWRENTPHLIAPKRYLVFLEEVCRIADI
jgi:hypothetical protein